MIRKATKEDIPVMAAMAHEMQKESPRFKDVSFDIEVVSNFLQIMIDAPERCCFVSESDGKIVGMMGGITVPYFFSLDENYACDIGLYVVPEMRRRAHAFQLIRAFEDWAIEKGVKPSNITIQISATNDPAVHEFIRRMGYTNIGVLYKKEV